MTTRSETSGKSGQRDRATQLLNGDDEVESGPLSDRMARIEPVLLSFGAALGGVSDSLSALPFTEEADLDEMPEPLYVRHDEGMLNQVSSWLLEGQHVGLTSPHGTGKSALREIVKRDLGSRDDFVVASLHNPSDTTARGLYETVLRAASADGYEVNPDGYWQVKDGVPWITGETKRAVREVTRRARYDGTTVLLVVDELEDVDPDLLAPLQTVADAGVRLFLLGTPDAREHLASFRETLDSRVRFYEGVEPFDTGDIAEYIGRSLARFRGESYDGTTPNLFSADAIRYVHEETGGNPRQVRLTCLDLFTRAAFVWNQVDAPIERVTITSALADRDLELGSGSGPGNR